MGIGLNWGRPDDEYAPGPSQRPPAGYSREAPGVPPQEPFGYGARQAWQQARQYLPKWQPDAGFLTPPEVTAGYRQGGWPGVGRALGNMVGDSARDVYNWWNAPPEQALASVRAGGGDAAPSRRIGPVNAAPPQQQDAPTGPMGPSRLPPSGYGMGQMGHVGPGEGLLVANVRDPNAVRSWEGVSGGGGPRYYDAEEIARLRAQAAAPEAGPSHQVAYRYADGRLSKEVDGQAAPLRGTVSYLQNDQTAASAHAMQQHAMGMARLKAGLPYDAGEANAAIQRNISTRFQPEAPSQWELETAAKNASRGDPRFGEKARYQEMLARANPQLGLEEEKLGLEGQRIGMQGAQHAGELGWRQAQLAQQGQQFQQEIGLKQPAYQVEQMKADLLGRVAKGDVEALTQYRALTRGADAKYDFKTVKQYQDGLPSGETLYQVDPSGMYPPQAVSPQAGAATGNPHQDAQAALQRGMPLAEVNRRLKAAGLSEIRG